MECAALERDGAMLVQCRTVTAVREVWADPETGLQAYVPLCSRHRTVEAA